MNKEYIPVNEPLLDGNEENYLVECIRSGWISSEGPFVAKFEELFALRVGRKYGVAVSNGSVALDAAVVALGIGKGDEVIMPSFTIISCAAAVIRAGGVPVLVDSDPLTWNMDCDQIENLITQRTKAIMIVHIYGLPVNVVKILAIAKKYGLLIIEDAAEMHGQSYYGEPCGSFGDISTFSFYPNKHITTGEGGMIVTDSYDIAERCRSLRNLCFHKEQRFKHYELGWNYRMTNLQAALGLAQLERLDYFVEKKRVMGKLYTSLFEGVAGLQLPLPSVEYAENIYWVYGLVLDDAYEFEAQEVMRKLNSNGVGSRPFFWPMHEQPVLKKMGLFNNEKKYPTAERIARRGFYIPSGLALTEKQIIHSAEVLIRVLS